MRIVLLNEIPEDESLRHQWNALVERNADPQVFYTYEWALAVQLAYGRSLNPRIFLSYDEKGQLIGVVALAQDPSTHRISFLCSTTADYCDYLSAPEDRDAFVAAVFTELKRVPVTSITLANLPADSATVKAIGEHAGRYGFRRFQRRAYACAQVCLPPPNQRQAGNLCVGRTKAIRRSLKAISAAGPIRLDHLRDWSALQAELPVFMRAHVARFLTTGRISNIARVERQLFLRELARLLSDSGWLCLTRLMTGTKAAAWNYGFQFHGSWFWYQPAFDSEMEKYSPGQCLLNAIVEESAENPHVHTIDLGLGAEEYKDRVANHRRETLYVTLRASVARHVMEMARYGAAKLAKSSPRIEHMARSVRDAFQHLTKRVRKDGVWETVGWLLRRARTTLASREEVYFYELISNPAASSAPLQKIDLDLLASAAMLYADDEETLTYFLRCAPRLRVKEYVGFALLNEHSVPVHFTWASPFTGFHWDELNDTVPAPSADAVVLFDSWTPARQRGRSYYGPTLAAVAARIRQQGKQAWGFSAAGNVSSVRGLEKMGFPRRFSMVRHKILQWQWLSRRNAQTAIGTERLEPVA